MENIKFPIAIATFVLLVYILMPYIGLPFVIIFFTMLLLTGLTIWMVISILKDGKAPDITFEDQWYEDRVK